MGETCANLLPYEALPGIDEHGLVFHNGKGFYYICKDYLTSLDKREYECVRRDCHVTATMGPALDCPLVDIGSHTHPADWDYRDKCLLLHTIRQRFLQENTMSLHVLQDVLASLLSEEDVCDDAGSVIYDDYTMSDFMETEVDNENDTVEGEQQEEVKEEEYSYQNLTESLNEYQSPKRLMSQQNMVEFPRVRTHKQVRKKCNTLETSSSKIIPDSHQLSERHESNPRIADCLEVYHEEEIVSEPNHESNSESSRGVTKKIQRKRPKVPQRRSVIKDSEGFMYCVNRTVNDTKNPKKRKMPSVTEDELRLNGRMHVPNFLSPSKSKDCCVCSKRKTGQQGDRKRTRMFCETCPNKPGLHPGLCFTRYHTMKKFKLE